MNNKDVASAILPFSMYFSLDNGMSDTKKTTKRFLSQMKGMYYDAKAYDEMLEQGDCLIYEFYEMDIPATEGDLAFGTSITYPGKVGNEYFMTKGHFHKIIDTAEVYYCIGGKGIMLMEDSEGRWDSQEMTPGKVVYAPKGFAHRSINTGNEPLITFFVFRADAGHDYATIETLGYRKLMLEKEGSPTIENNPNWNK